MSTESAARVRDAVLAAASENSSLLVRLASTGDGPGLYHAHLVHVTYIRNALTQQTTELESLKESIRAQFKVHSKFRDSSFRRFFYRASGMLEKFDTKAMEVERAYFTALGEQSDATKREAQLKRDYEETVNAQGPLEAAAKEHDEVHAKIDALYESLFAGPTPGFAHEDQQENSFYTSRTENEATKERILAARRALRYLGLAKTSLERAQRSMAYAINRVEESVLFFDDAYQSLRSADERRRHALVVIDRAEEHLLPLSPQISSTKQALLFLLNAAKISPGTYPSSRESVRSTAASTHGHLSEAESKLNELFELLKERERDGLATIRVTARRLEDTRQELQHVRQGIFEKEAGFGEAAPAYHECCDRADAFCAVPEASDNHEQEQELENELDVQVRREMPNDAVVVQQQNHNDAVVGQQQKPNEAFVGQQQKHNEAFAGQQPRAY